MAEKTIQRYTENVTQKRTIKRIIRAKIRTRHFHIISGTFAQKLTFALLMSRTTTDKMAEFFDKLSCEKFAYVKKKQYLCTMKTRTIVNIILAVIAWVMLNLVILRVILRIAGIA